MLGRNKQNPKAKQESASVYLSVSYRHFTTEDLLWLQNSNVKTNKSDKKTVTRNDDTHTFGNIAVPV